MSVIIGHYQFLDSHRSLSVIISHYQCMLRIVHYHSLSFIMNFFTHIGHYQSLSVIINFLHRIGYYKSSFGHYKCLPRISHYRSLSISKLSLNSFQGIFCLLSVDNDRCEVIIGHFQGFFFTSHWSLLVVFIGHYHFFYFSSVIINHLLVIINFCPVSVIIVHYKILDSHRSLSISKLSLNRFQGIFCLALVDNYRCEAITWHQQIFFFFLPRIGHYQSLSVFIGLYLSLSII